MKNHISVREFLSKLADSSSFELSDLAKLKRVSDVSCIEPQLKVIKEESDKPYVIISASGAVGKTTIAKYCTKLRKGYYWDLAGQELGVESFSGGLLKSFGPKQIGKVIEYLEQGKVSLFIDSFDEAEIVSGWSGIELFLEDVVKYSKTSDNPNIILFSRPETALLLQMKIDECFGSPACSLYEIDYFDEKGAVDFVEYEISNNGGENHYRHRTVFKEVVSSIFRVISHSIINKDVDDIWQEDEVRQFIGYSPVLQTVAGYLKNQNYSNVATEFEKSKSSQKGINIIRNFIVSILEREQIKFINGLKSKVTSPSTWLESNWNEYYTILDQINYVTKFIYKQKNTNFQETQNPIPGWLEKSYREAVEQNIHNHPFIKSSDYASPAFRDFSLSLLINDGSSEKRAIEIIDTANFALTPLFFFFYKEISNNCCKGTHIGYLYDSYLSKSRFDDNIEIVISQTANHTMFEIIDEKDVRVGSDYFKCKINDQIPLVFKHKVANGVINIDHDVIIGRDSKSIELKNIEITANNIHVNCRELRVTSKSGNSKDVVVLNARGGIISSDYALSINVLSDKSTLIVAGENSQIYPWIDYSKRINKDVMDNIVQHIYNLKRILVHFRKHKRGEFAKQYEFIDNEIIKDNVNRKCLLEFLIEEKVLVKRQEDRKYYMYEEKSIEYGISWNGLRMLDYNNDLVAFLNRFKEKYSNKLINE